MPHYIQSLLDDSVDGLIFQHTGRRTGSKKDPRSQLLCTGPLGKELANILVNSRSHIATYHVVSW